MGFRKSFTADNMMKVFVFRRVEAVVGTRDRRRRRRKGNQEGERRMKRDQ